VTAHFNRIRVQAGSHIAVNEAVTTLDDAVDAWLGSTRTG
jgi:hypothetical protein